MTISYGNRRARIHDKENHRYEHTEEHRDSQALIVSKISLFYQF